VLARARVPALRNSGSRPDLARESGRVADEQIKHQLEKSWCTFNSPMVGQQRSLMDRQRRNVVMPVGGGGACGRKN
jgi:hypothetical protein